MYLNVLQIQLQQLSAYLHKILIKHLGYTWWKLLPHSLRLASKTFQKTILQRIEAYIDLSHVLLAYLSSKDSSDFS